MSILPNRMMSKVGRHRNLAPAKVVSTYDEKFVASAANDGLIKLVSSSTAASLFLKVVCLYLNYSPPGLLSEVDVRWLVLN